MSKQRIYKKNFFQGFSSSLRSATSGLADFSVQIAGYEAVSDERLVKIKNELSGIKS